MHNAVALENGILQCRYHRKHALFAESQPGLETHEVVKGTGVVALHQHCIWHSAGSIDEPTGLRGPNRSVSNPRRPTPDRHAALEDLVSEAVYRFFLR